MRRVMIYGAYGYSGTLAAQQARDHGIEPVLAGRSAARVSRVARDLGMEYRVFSVDRSGSEIDGGLEGIGVLLNCAGPFSRTAAALADGALRAGCHYLDITGEIAVFEDLARRDREAREAGVMLLPGAGFDVVPTDCLAAHLSSRLPSATRLELAFRPIGGGISHGTATTMVENMDRGCVIRQDGRLVEVPAAHRTKDINFGRGPVTCVSVPWGDVSTAYRSTGIGDITVFTALPTATQVALKLSRYLSFALRSGVIQGAMKSWLDRRPAGPTDIQRASGKSLIWGEVRDPDGNSATSTLITAEGYTLTATASLTAAALASRDEVPTGVHTPSSAFGADFILTLPSVERVDR